MHRLAAIASSMIATSSTGRETDFCTNKMITKIDRERPDGEYFDKSFVCKGGAWCGGPTSVDLRRAFRVPAGFVAITYVSGSASTPKIDNRVKLDARARAQYNMLDADPRFERKSVEFLRNKNGLAQDERFRFD